MRETERERDRARDGKSNQNQFKSICFRTMKMLKKKKLDAVLSELKVFDRIREIKTLTF